MSTARRLLSTGPLPVEHRQGEEQALARRRGGSIERLLVPEAGAGVELAVAEQGPRPVRRPLGGGVEQGRDEPAGEVGSAAG
ncbi:hypothetical protein [Kitasatospora sp. HPMI-4]|uniref:hypothetical protein n=1 Tax=Kitasatospora sp. HPMI-4 TaxID=3448443 RepID=UPI003F1D0CC7